MSKYLLALLLLGSSISVHAQYTMQGTIEYARKINIHRQLEDMSDEDNSEWFARMKSQIPQFNTSYFNYSFTTDKSIYRPGKESENNLKMFGNSPASENIVYTDFNTERVTANKQIFEEKYLVQDTVRKIEWKIEDEIRTIANYKCRKAVGIICDSVYVVAFYTEDIMVSGGPEMFAGLPGMILEIAVPRLYSTWIATNINIASPASDDFKIPEKGKKTTQHEMFEDLMTSISKWGKWAQRSIWWSML